MFVKNIKIKVIFKKIINIIIIFKNSLNIVFKKINKFDNYRKLKKLMLKYNL